MATAPALARRHRPAASDPVLAILLGSVACVLIVGVIVFQGGLSRNTALAMALAAVALALFATARTGLALAVLMLYLGLLDGFLKLRTGVQITTLGRDLLLYAIAGGAFLRLWLSHEPIGRPPLFGLIVVWVVIVLVSVLNPNVPDTQHALAGIRPHLEFVPLFFLGYAVMRSKRAIRAFLVLLLVIASVNGVVGFIQGNLSPEQLASWGPGYAERVQGTGGFEGSGRTFSDGSGTSRVRPLALGSDVGFGGIVGVIALSAAAALLVARPRSRTLLVVSVLTAGAVLAVISSQTRVAVVGAVATLFGFALLTAVSRNAIRTLIVGVLVTTIVYVTISLAVGASSDLLGRYESIAPDRLARTTASERGGSFTGTYSQALRYPFGFGTGTVGPGAGSRSNNPEELTGENQAAYLQVEVGLQGLLVIAALATAVLFWSFTRIRRLPDRELRLLLAGLAGALVGLTVVAFGGAVTSNTPGGPYVWFTAGTLAWWLSARPRRLAAAGP